MGRQKGQPIQFVGDSLEIKKPKKKRRYRPGTVALREIRTEQKSIKLAIPKRCFQRVVREIVQEKKGGEQTRFQKSAMEALQVASEDYLIRLFKDAGMLGLFSGRLSIFAKDLQMARYLRQSM